MSIRQIQIVAKIVLLKLRQNFGIQSKQQNFLKLFREKCYCFGQIIRYRSLLIAVPTLGFITISETPSTKSRDLKLESQTLSLDWVVKCADRLFDEENFEQVISTLVQYADQNSPEIQWRKGRAYFCLSQDISDKCQQEQLIRKAYSLIHMALSLDDTNHLAHHWMATVTDANARLDGTKARILQFETIKYHINRSVELNPHDPRVWHQLGDFEYHVASLQWIERKLIGSLLNSAPQGSYKRALEFFTKAESIRPGYNPLTQVMLGKCYLALKKPQEARFYLEMAANCRVLNGNHKRSKEEANELLKKL